ncbi:hypothetical protein ATN84_06670 [Paramesorhizobium deserti]|uniref:Transmembrane protein n=1 Tax=Paramesorhizobium deserti TaxID=1494590 RepID=A0A135I1S3_9HYPH|nr:hypothetical protein [Paramesorhizobium deserti]KXF79387.1 hypothetical protein ATN84_06670 [Paramesorhizobium deserti]
MPFDDHSFHKKDHGSYYPNSIAGARSGVLRITLLFGSAAIALALILVPILNERSRDIASQSLFPDGVDTISTGSIRHSRAYTVRKSVLQSTPEAVCVIHPDGRKSGDC